jgi:TRAP-type C4-dicarboxylate transport system permease small subunit
MKAFCNYLDARMGPVRRTVNGFIVGIFAIQVIVVFSQVIWRFVFNNPFSWSEEIARFIQVWMILLTASICIKKGKHLAVDYATHALPFHYAKFLKIITMIIAMIFTVFIIIFGIQMMTITANEITPALRIPIAIVYAAFPIAGTLMFIETLILLIRTIGVVKEGDIVQHDDTEQQLR